MEDGYDVYCTQCNRRKRREKQQQRDRAPFGKFSTDDYSIAQYEQFKMDLEGTTPDFDDHRRTNDEQRRKDALTHLQSRCPDNRLGCQTSPLLLPFDENEGE